MRSTRVRLLSASLSFLLLVAAAPAGVRAAGGSPPTVPGRAAFAPPLAFEPNVGQTDARVRFVARARGYVVHVTGGGLDTHGMDPVTVLTSLQALGGTMPPTYVVGCRPESVEEGIGLTPTVADAVPIAADAVKRLVQRLATATPTRGR